MKIAGFCSVLSVLLLATRALGAPTVGDLAQPDRLPGALQAAYQNSTGDIVITPGTYEIPATNKQTIWLDHWHDRNIIAANVLIIFDERHHDPIRFEHCSHVSFEGATLRLKIAPDTQGRITAIGSDARGKWCDWQVDAGYRSDIDPKKMTFNVVDAQTRLLKVQARDVGVAASESLAPDRFRLHFGRQLPTLAVHDWLVTRADGGAVICHLSDCHDVTLRNLTFQNGGFGTMFETDGGGNHYLNCKIATGPKPPAATEEEIVSCGADGFHSVGTTIGPDIEDCDFSGVFLDDCIAVHGTFQKVISRGGTSIVMAGKVHDYQVGEPVRFSNEKGLFDQAICTGVKDLGNKQIEVTIDKSIDVPVGSKANNPDRCGRGFKILRCRLGNTRSRGILVKADDGLIDHCTIEGCGMSAISIGPEYYWNEANYCWNVTVSNNAIRNCVKGNGGDGTLWVHGDGAIGNRNIIIKDNRFVDNYGQYMMKLEWTDGLQITGNRIDGGFQLPLQKPGEIVHLAHDRHVNLKGNVVENTGPSFGKLIGGGDDVSDPAIADLTGIERK
jgi:hypothetical protein